MESGQSAEVSSTIAGLYTDMYSGGVERAWRDVGALDKSANIVRAWASAAGRTRPRIVEIGCGEGAVAHALHRQDFFSTYRGFDISSSGIDEARLRNTPGTEFNVVDGDLSHVTSDSADLVVLSHVVEHLEHPRYLLYQAQRIAPFVLVEVPLELNRGAPRDYVVDDLGHINKYNSLSIRHLIQSTGLVVVDQFTSNPSRAVAAFRHPGWRSQTKWLLKEGTLHVAPSLARSLFTYHETVIARRASAPA